MSSCSALEEFPIKFEKIMDDINELTLKCKPETAPDYQPLAAFDDLYTRVKYTRDKILTNSSSNASSKPVSKNNLIKLPPIELPSFDGKTQNWPIFYESFKANVHNNPSLNDSQRVQYLISKLTHNALKVTAGIVPTGETYKIIWENLVKKYQDNRVLGTHYLNNIFDLKPCTNTASSLNTFVDKYSASIAALKQLNLPDLTDFIFLHCGLKKLDSQTAQNFEMSLNDGEIPSYINLINFVQCQVKILERTCNNTQVNTRVSHTPVNSSKSIVTASAPHVSGYKSFVTRSGTSSTTTRSASEMCVLCNNSEHTQLYACPQFKAMNSPQVRFEYLKSKQGCVNCLSTCHSLTSCKSRHTCNICKKRHHTLLHFDSNTSQIRQNSNTHLQLHTHTDNYLPSYSPTHAVASVPIASVVPPACASVPQQTQPRPQSVANSMPDSNLNSYVANPPSNHHAYATAQHHTSQRGDIRSVATSSPTNASVSLSTESKPCSTILLSTAQVYAKLNSGDGKIIIRCLIDNGSQNNLITLNCCKALNLPIVPLNNSYIKGVGLISRPIHGYVYINIESRVYPNNKFYIHALVVDCITDKLPSHFIKKCDMSYLDSLPLADLTWNIPGGIDVVLGAQLFPYIYLGNRVESGSNAPPALLTAFGYVLMGDYPCTSHPMNAAPFAALTLNDLELNLNKFRELEEIPYKRYLSPEETECENAFISSVSPNEEGRLTYPLSEWPVKPFSPTDCDQLPEVKTNSLLTATVPDQCEQPILYALAQHMSSWEKLLRTVVYIYRFLKKVILSDEVTNMFIAEKAVVRAIQHVHFSDEITRLKGNKLPSKKLLKLSVFLDDDCILRIGGRLTKADLPFDVKHPVLLPKHDHIVDLIIDHYHIRNCHTGPSLLLSIIRQRFWILDARTRVRARVHKCNSCFRVNPSHPTPKMGDLPSYRLQEAKAFLHTGVDYAGPLRITLTRRRGQHAQKAYICLFVCLVTKAVHVELASDLTSDSFLAAFKRFISRRGPVAYLYSDNGTNFIGAKAQLDDMYNFLQNSTFQNNLNRELINHRITWKMIPPRAPHFGSLWESNVKSFKTHLYRTIGSQLLTYEELLTVLVQIECILNSRPLVVISSDPQPEVLTPAHFLMTTPLQYLPASDLSDERLSLTNRKKLLDSLVHSYWKKWRMEYLHTLQVRNKWCTPDNPVQVGTVVLIGQDDAPTLNWPLGVITKVYPGTDNVVRVAHVKTRNGEFKRPVVKLYPLPSQ